MKNKKLMGALAGALVAGIAAAWFAKNKKAKAAKA
jgi:hypothetical protein